MLEDSLDIGDEIQGAARCDPKYTRWILHAIHKIRSQKSRPSTDRICRRVLQCHPKADIGEIEEQLELCVQDGKVHKVMHKGLPSYRDPGVYKQNNLQNLIEVAISASTCKRGSTFGRIQEYIKKSYALNSDLRSQLTLALNMGVISGRLVTDGVLYRIADSNLPAEDQNCGLRIAKSKGPPPPKKRKHVPRISESSEPLAKKKKRKHVPRISDRSAPLAKKKKILEDTTEGYAYQPVLGIADSSELLAQKEECAQRTVVNCVPFVKGDQDEDAATLGVKVDQSKYTKWIVQAICKIRKERQRPSEDCICREVVKAHQDASVQEIKKHLDFCTQEGKILPVSFLGKTSYRIPEDLFRTRNNKYINKVCKQSFLQRLEAAITNLAEEGGSSLKSIKKYMGQSCNVNLLREVTKEGVACGRLQKNGSLYRIARNSHKPSCVGEKLNENAGMVYKAQAERVDATQPATSIFQESKMEIQYAATSQDLSHLELLIPTRCKYCQRYFPSVSRYRIHKRRHERTIRPYWYRKSCDKVQDEKGITPLGMREHELNEHGTTCVVCGNRSKTHEKHTAQVHVCKKCQQSIAGMMTSEVVPDLWIPITKCALCHQRTAKHKEHPNLCKNCNDTFMGAANKNWPLNSTAQITCVVNKPVCLTAKSASQGQVGNSNAQVTCVECGQQSAASGKQVCTNCNHLLCLVPAKKASLGPAKKSTKGIKSNKLLNSMDEEKLYQKACEWCGKQSVKHEEHPGLCKNCYKNRSVQLKAAKSNTNAGPVQIKAAKSKKKAGPVQIKAAKSKKKASPVQIKAAKSKKKAGPDELKAAKSKKEAGPVQIKGAKSKKKAGPVQIKAAKSKKKASPVQIKAAKSKKKAGPDELKAAKSKKEAGPVQIKAAKSKKKAGPVQIKAAKSKKNAGPDELKAAKSKKKAGPVQIKGAKSKKKASQVQVKAAKSKKKASQVQVKAAKSKQKAGQESSTCKENMTSKSSQQEQAIVIYKCGHCIKAFLQFDELKVHETAEHKQQSEKKTLAHFHGV